MQGQQLIMIGGHGNGRWTAMEGIFIMVGRCGGDQNLRFKILVLFLCKKTGKYARNLLTSS